MGKRPDEGSQLQKIAFGILLAWFVLTLVFILHHLTDAKKRVSPTPVSDGTSLSSKVTPDKVGRHYRSAYIKKTMEEQRIDNELTREEAKRGLPDTGEPIPLDNQSTWPSMDAVHEQSGRFGNEKPKYDVLTPQDRIQESLIEDQQESLENERQRDEFIRQFKENARQHGVDVIIDKNLRAYPRKATPQ